MNNARPDRLVLASGNAGKLREFGALLREWQCELLPQSAFAVRPVAETGRTFADNALLKARAAARGSGLPALADDSGLCVDALDGAPGIFSARYAGPGATAADNNRKLLAALAALGSARRDARFHCALVYLRSWHDPSPIICEATWDGVILDAPRGDGGFGYDPIFFIPTENRSAAQLEPDRKNQISHRGQALRQLQRRLADEWR